MATNTGLSKPHKSLKSIVQRVNKDRSCKDRAKSCTDKVPNLSWSSRARLLPKRSVHVVTQAALSTDIRDKNQIKSIHSMGKSGQSTSEPAPGPSKKSKQNTTEQSERSSPQNDSERRSRSKERSNEKRRSREKSPDDRRAKKRKTSHVISESEDEDVNASEIRALKTRLAEFEKELKRKPVYQENSDEFEYDGQDDDYDNFSIKLSESQNDHLEEGECDDISQLESILTEGANTTEKGKPLAKETLKLVEHFFDKDPSMQTISAIRDRYPEPENCSNLSAKTVNPEVARGLPKHVKKRDFCLNGIQNSIATSAIANLRAIEELTKLHKEHRIKGEEANNLLKPISDSTKILSRAFADISIFRKVSMRSNVLPKYQQLCTKRTYGNLLFGEDFSKEIKHIDDESKIMRNIGRGHGFYPAFQGYDDRQPKNYYARGRGQFRPQFRGRRPFRGRGRSPARPPFRGAHTAPNSFQ